MPSPPPADDPGRIAAALVVAVIDGDRPGAELLLRDCDLQTCGQVAVSLAIMLVAAAEAPPERIRARMTEILQQHPPLLWAAAPCASTEGRLIGAGTWGIWAHATVGRRFPRAGGQRHSGCGLPAYRQVVIEEPRQQGKSVGTLSLMVARCRETPGTMASYSAQTRLAGRRRMLGCVVAADPPVAAAQAD